MDKKVQRILDLIAENDPAWRTQFALDWDCIKNLADLEAIRILLSPANPGSQVGANLIDPTINGVAIGHFQAAYGTGTPYSLTNVAALLNMGTTDPDITITQPGTYLIRAVAHLAAAGATVVAETAALKVRRTNNIAADVSAVLPVDLPVMTTLTHSLGLFVIPEFEYTTLNSDDILQVFGNVSAALGAGTIDAIAIGTFILAQRTK